MFFALKAQKSLFKAMLVRTIAILLLAPAFIYIFGDIGIVYEFILTAAVYGLERYRSLKKVMGDFRLDLKSFIKFDQDDRALLEKIIYFFKKKILKLNNRSVISKQ